MSRIGKFLTSKKYIIVLEVIKGAPGIQPVTRHPRSRGVSEPLNVKKIKSNKTFFGGP
jgi:hypothetical protein